MRIVTGTWWAGCPDLSWLRPGLCPGRVCSATGPGAEHLAIFEQICRDSGATGKLVADAQHAAVAIENGCTMVTTDSDYDRFPGLRWQHPLRPGQ